MKLKLLSILIGIALIAAACGSADEGSPDTPPTPTADPTTTPRAPTTTTIQAQPAEVRFTGADGVESVISDVSSIVSLSGDITEVIWELGLGGSIVAIDVTTTFPLEAADNIPVVGFGQMLSPEPVLAFSPSLVIGDQLTGPPEVIEQLRSAGVPVVILTSQSTLAGVETKITQIGEMLSAQSAASALVERVNAEIDEARALVAQAVAAGAETPRIAYLYVGRGPVLFFGQGMATNAMINGAGALDVGAESGVQLAVPVTPEALVAASPEIIVLPEAGLQALGGADALNEIPGFSQTPAGQAGNFFAYDEAYFFNLGPRVGQALKEFVLDLYPELTSGS